MFSLGPPLVANNTWRGGGARSTVNQNSVTNQLGLRSHTFALHMHGPLERGGVRTSGWVEKLGPLLPYPALASVPLLRRVSLAGPGSMNNF